MSKVNYFFKKGKAFIQKAGSEPEPIIVNKERFKKIAEEIVKKNPNCSDLNILVQKAMTEYTGGARITKRTGTHYSSVWIELKELVGTLTEKIEEEF